MTTKKKGKLPVWARIILLLIMFLIVVSVFQMLTALALNVDIQEMNEFTNLNGYKQLGIQAAGLLGTLISVFVFRKFIDKESFISLGFNTINIKSEILWGFIIGIFVIAGGTLLLIILGNVEYLGFTFRFKSLALSFLLFIIVAISEELLVRGYILNNLLDVTNKYVALVISSVLFALMHGFNNDISLLPLINLFLAGVLLGSSYIYTRSLWFPISLHLFWNYLQGPIFGYSVSGHTVDSLLQIETNGSSILSGGSFGFEGSIVCVLFQIIAIVFVLRKYKNVTN